MNPALIALSSAALLAGSLSGQRTAPTSSAKGLEGVVITIDPGHNGENGANPGEINQQVAIGNGETKECDTTGSATASGYDESKFTMNVARRLTRLLEADGAKVVLTRNDNHGVGPCIDKRARIGNRAHSDAAISIHADGGPSSGHGYHVIRPSRIEGLTDDIYNDSKLLADKVRGGYERETGLPPANYIGSNGIDERSDLGGLRLSDVPKVFIETGNMQNPGDAAKLESSSFRQRIAEGLELALERFIRTRN